MSLYCGWRLENHLLKLGVYYDWYRLSTFKYCRSACRRRKWVISCRLRLGPPPSVCEEEDSSFLRSIPTSLTAPPSSSVLLSSKPQSKTVKPPGWTDRTRLIVTQINKWCRVQCWTASAILLHFKTLIWVMLVCFIVCIVSRITVISFY